jgi:class 3 adenylate cyclase
MIGDGERKRRVIMRAFSHWSIRYKLLSLLLLLGVTTFAVTGTIAYIKYEDALHKNVLNQLGATARSKRFQIEAYYRIIGSHAESLSADRMIIVAIREFRAAYSRMDAGPIPEEHLNAVREDYRVNFYPRMQELHIARPRVADYLPNSPASIQLQYLYITKNPHRRGQRDELAKAGDGSEYSRIHEKYHDAFKAIVEKFGYPDLYLIDRTGRILYDVAKDRDFATNLMAGPYANSNLANVVRQCLATDNRDDIFISDFEPYEASEGEPTQYVASPVFDGSERLGVIALQLSTAEIDRVMTANRGWVKNGLGETGESILIGSDHLQRSDSRLFLEDPEKFFAKAKSAGVPEETLNRIRILKTTILQMPVNAAFVKDALNGKEGTVEEKKLPRFEYYLVSYMPLQIDGLHWVIASQMTLNEALKPIEHLKRLFRWWGSGLLLLTVIGALLMTRHILRPVNALVRAAERVAAGDLTAQVDWKSNDELGVLAGTFNSMTKSIREKTEQIEEKNRENEALLLNILPEEIAARLKEGEHEIADSFADVTVLFGDIVGFTALSSTTSPTRIVQILNGLFSKFDEIAQELGIEKIKTIGDCYMAVCGLPRSCPDHTVRAARMALQMVEVTGQYSQQIGTSLKLRVGINSGPVVAGVIGTTKFIYDLWGDTVNLASRMESTGVPGQIQVTRRVYERLREGFELESRGVVQVKGKGEIETWLLRGELSAVEVPQ